MRFLLLTLFSFSICQASTIKLIGQVISDDGKPISKTRISVSGKFEDVTDDSGAFKIFLSSDYIEGERVILNVAKPGWIINHPIDGEWNLPNIKYQNVQTTKVILVPKGSIKLWTNDRIQRYIGHIALLSNQVGNLNKEGDIPKPVDFSIYLKEWAEKYGFTPEQVKKTFDEWADSTKGIQDYRTLGLREFYLKNFSSAAEYFIKAAHQTQERINGEELVVYQNWRDAGASYSARYQFKKALEMYESAKAMVTLEKNPMEWAEIRLLLGNACGEIGKRMEGQESLMALERAIIYFHEIQKIYTREQWPQQWAVTQHNLGTVFCYQGSRTAGEEGNKHLAQAVEAFHLALQVRTYEKFPYLWAVTQNNLGATLDEQGSRAVGEEGTKLYAQAIEAYRCALIVHTREQWPHEWATSQLNIGTALWYQGTRIPGEEGTKLLAKAVEADRCALQVFKREQWPQEWSMAQNNLGAALEKQGTRMSGEEVNTLFDQAVEAYRYALQIRTHDQLPQQWAETQNHLGAVLWNQGTRIPGDEGTKLFAKAAEAFRCALQVYTREQFSKEWAIAQDNLDHTLKEIRAREKYKSTFYTTVLGGFMKVIFPGLLIFGIMMILNHCSSKAPKAVLGEFLNVYESYCSDMGKVESTGDVCAALNNASAKMKDIIPQMKELTKKYPDIEDIQKGVRLPELFKEYKQRFSDLGQKQMKAIANAGAYLKDPKVMESQKKFIEVMNEMIHYQEISFVDGL